MKTRLLIRKHNSLAADLDVNEAIRFGDKEHRRQVNLGWTIGLLLIAFHFAVSLYISGKRLFWYDEIITFQVSTLPSVRLVARALLNSADIMTPGYLLIVRFFVGMLHNPEMASRLPSALAVSVGYLAVFDSARRLTTTLGGVLALAALMNSFLPQYAYEARSYGFYFMCSSLALWVWLFVRPRIAPVLFGMCFMAGEFLHYYFALCLVPYTCYELYGMFQRRSIPLPSPMLISGFAGISAACLIMLPFIYATHQMSKLFWAVPKVYFLAQIYADYFPNAPLLLALCFFWLSLCPRGNSLNLTIDATGPERLGWLFLLIPPAGFLLALLVTNAFHHRYFIGLLPGVVLAFACQTSRLLASRKTAFAGVAVLFCLACVYAEARAAWHPELIDPANERFKTRNILRVEQTLFQDGKRFLVPCDPLLFSELSHYSRQPKSVWLFADLSNSPKTSSEVQLAVNLDPFLRQQLWDLPNLEKHAGESALIDPSEDLTQTLRAAGFHLTIRFAQPMNIVYLSR